MLDIKYGEYCFVHLNSYICSTSCHYVSNQSVYILCLTPTGHITPEILSADFHIGVVSVSSANFCPAISDPVWICSISDAPTGI